VSNTDEAWARLARDVLVPAPLITRLTAPLEPRLVRRCSAWWLEALDCDPRGGDRADPSVDDPEQREGRCLPDDLGERVATR
jgi:hypothetical protein